MANDDYETWEANGRIVLRKFDASGSLQEVLVNAGRRIQLTERERIMNQDRVAEESMDPFANGTLAPVRLPDSSKASAQALVDSPNTISEEEMRELLVAHHKTFDKKISEITSPYVVRRMLALAENEDDEELEVSMKRIDLIQARLRDLTEDSDVQVVERHRIA